MPAAAIWEAVIGADWLSGWVCDSLVAAPDALLMVELLRYLPSLRRHGKCTGRVRGANGADQPVQAGVRGSASNDTKPAVASSTLVLTTVWSNSGSAANSSRAAANRAFVAATS